MGWFSKRKDASEPPAKSESAGAEPAEKPAERIRWSTNAPAHWPALETEPLPKPNPTTVGDHGEDLVMLAGALAEAFKKSGATCQPPCRLAGIFQNRLTPQGILIVWLEVNDGDEKHAVFPYFNVGPENSGHFSAAKAILKARGEPEPYWYALEPLSPAPPGEALQPFNPQLLHTAKDVVPGRYAMWWAAEGEPAFPGSATRRYIGEVYEALDGVQSYLLAALLRELGLVEPGVGRFIGDADVEVPLKGFENKPLYLCISREKGVQFCFHMEQCSPAYRDAFWKLYAEHVAALRRVVEDKKLPRDEKQGEYDPLAWWRFSAKVMEASPVMGGGEVQVVGCLEVPGS